MKKIFVNNFESKIGPFYTAETEKGLAVMMFGDRGKTIFDSVLAEDYKNFEVFSGGRENKKAQDQITKYLDGKLKIFDLKLDIKGTPFQLKALKEVASIPYGKTVSYGEIAARLGNPKAARAVGSANRRNPLPIVIPCHRVVASNGIGGYGGSAKDTKMKRHLLSLEGVNI